MSTVTSKDGTTIAYTKQGEGPALILVDGALCFRLFGPISDLAKALAPHFTVYNFDRRGRGESGNTLPFAVDREIEDIEALIDEAGRSAYLYGLSSGAALAMETALELGSKVKRLVMYEPPYKGAVGSETFNKQLTHLLDADRRGAAVEFFLKSLGFLEEMVAGTKQSPVWPKLEALAPTIIYDTVVVGDHVPTERAAKVTVPTVIMCGDVSYGFMKPVAETLSKTIPNAELRVLKGQGHAADPEVLASALVEVFKETK